MSLGGAFRVVLAELASVGLDPAAVCCGAQVGAVVRIEHRDAIVFVAFHLGRELPRHAVEYVVARTAMSLRRSGAGACEVRFRHAPGGAPDEYRRVLRCPVRFRQHETGLSLPAAELARPLRTANPDAAEALAAGLSRSQVRYRSSVSARLAGVAEAAIARGERIDRETLARSLGMSGKTLARRLALEERLFSEVVEGVRRTLAEGLVREGRNLTEVAQRVGYADPAAFGKAFRRWFGESPSVFRARRRPPV
jgi:AraC-like DNA-binding protein